MSSSLILEPFLTKQNNHLSSYKDSEDQLPMVDMDILIRRYESGDFDPVTRLWRRSREISLPDFQREKGYSFEMDQAYFKNHILAKNDVWIAETQSELVGFMAILEDLIDHLYVDPDHWRLGIGKTLLDHARTLSPRHLWLYTLQINTNARVFYVKNGFIAKKFGISPPPESEPDVEYHWNPVKQCSYNRGNLRVTLIKSLSWDLTNWKQQLRNHLGRHMHR